MAWQKIVVLNFENQSAHKLARSLRLLGFHSEVASPTIDLKDLKGTAGIILSDGPASLYNTIQPELNRDIFTLEVPILGIGYGHQLMAQHYEGQVGKALIGESGYSQLEQNTAVYSPLLLDIEDDIQVWMEHGDEVQKLPKNFEIVASTKVCKYAVIQDLNRGRFGFQYSVESKNTTSGSVVLYNFARFCGMEKNWDQDIVLELMLAKIRFLAGNKKVLIFLSGGVDSNVAFTLLNKSLGQKRVLGIHIDNGFLRKDESLSIAQRFRDFGFTNFVVADASKSFLKILEGVVDSNQKRLLEGAYFRHVQNKLLEKFGLKAEDWLIALNTLYTGNTSTNISKIKGMVDLNDSKSSILQYLIQKGEIIEPLKELYKDEVKVIGERMGLQGEMICRHPFPELGLSVNVLCSPGEISPEEQSQLTHLQLDLVNLISKEGMQATSATILPIKAIRLRNKKRSFSYPVALVFDSSVPRNWLTVLQSMEEHSEGIDSKHREKKQQFPWYHIPRWRVLERVSSFITDSLQDVSRVVVRLYQRPNIDLKLQEGYCDKRRLDQTREADHIVIEGLKRFGQYEDIFQHLTINLPYASTPDHCSIVLRPIQSEDIATAKFSHMNHLVLSDIMEHLIELPFVDAVYYDITNKPPAPFSWE